MTRAPRSPSHPDHRRRGGPRRPRRRHRLRGDRRQPHQRGPGSGVGRRADHVEPPHHAGPRPQPGDVRRRRDVTTADLDDAYGGEGADGLDELVGSAALDPGIADTGARNAAATDAVWAGWADEPTLVDPDWQSIGVGEVECADGRLYMTLVLRDDIPGIEQPADTSQIELVSTVTQDGYRIQFFRNLAYGCSISGDQTFIIATPVGQSATSTRPLWVKMHGGGVGYFDPSGTPIPASNKAQEGRALADRADRQRPDGPHRSRARRVPHRRRLDVQPRHLLGRQHPGSEQPQHPRRRDPAHDQRPARHQGRHRPRHRALPDRRRVPPRWQRRFGRFDAGRMGHGARGQAARRHASPTPAS